jgi:septal ring factor EnvC (AmiA/AmiB activator)
MDIGSCLGMLLDARPSSRILARVKGGEAMSTALIVEIILGVFTAGIAAIALIVGLRANKEQAKASSEAVDAMAYGRAKDIYESAIESLKEQTRALHDQVVDLQTEVSRLRTQSADLQSEVSRLRSSNAELRATINVLESKKGPT